MPNAKKEQIKSDLQDEIVDFFQCADASSCINSLNYLMLSIDEDVEPLTAMERAHLRSLQQLLNQVSALQRPERILL